MYLICKIDQLFENNEEIMLGFYKKFEIFMSTNIPTSNFGI